MYDFYLFNLVAIIIRNGRLGRAGRGLARTILGRPVLAWPDFKVGLDQPPP